MNLIATHEESSNFQEVQNILVSVDDHILNIVMHYSKLLMLRGVGTGVWSIILFLCGILW